MYCYIIFGESNDNHTKRYLYKCDELVPGDTVIVPVKNSHKMALVHSVLKEIPEKLNMNESSVKKVIGLNSDIIENKNIISYILAMIDEYKDGNISKEFFCDVIEHFISVNKRNSMGNSERYAMIWLQLSNIGTFCMDEPEGADEKELNFWKKLKDIEYGLRYDHSFWDKKSMGIKTDPIEYSDEYLKIELEVERLIRAEIGEGDYMGFCYRYWWTKKNILKDKFGIDWKSPSDLNPEVNFD